MEKRAFGIWLVGASVALALMACGDEPAGNQVGSLPRVDTTRPAGTGGETPDATDPAEDVASSGVGADAEQDAGPVDTPSPVAAGSIGAACQQAGDCDGVDAVCLDLPGGYCVLANCTEGSCPEGSACFAFEGGEDYCIQTCQSQ